MVSALTSSPPMAILVFLDEDGDQPMKQNAFVPRILASINDDTAVDEMHSAWSVRVAAALIAEHAVVCVRSNRWPGGVLLFPHPSLHS